MGSVIQVTILLKTIHTRTFQHVSSQRTHNRSTALERSVKDYWGGGGRGGVKHGLLDSGPLPLLLQWFEIFGRHDGSLTHQ